MTAGKIVLATFHVRRSAQAVPLAAGCLAAALPGSWREKAVLVDIFPDQDLEQSCREILAGSPQVVAFPLYLWNRSHIRDLARRLRQREPNLKLVCGGPEATPQAERLLQEAPFDVVIRGEGERPLSLWLTALDRCESWDAIPGLSWQDSEGHVHHNPLAVPPADLDHYPSPWLSGILRPTPEGGVLWEVARGCPFSCDFCYDAGGYQGVRHHSEERLRTELELFVRLGVSQVWVLDSTFNFPPERGVRLLQLLLEKAPQIHFHLEAKADFLDPQTAGLLAQLTGSIQVGLQSARPDILKQQHRPLDLKRFEHALHLLNIEGVTFGLDLIYGLPGDTYQGFCQSLAFALKHAPNHIDIFPLAVLPGTSLEGKARALGLAYEMAPPYQVLTTPTMPSATMALCADLAAAVELFYNLGRAVGFLPSLLHALDLAAVDFFTDFARWVQQEQGLYREVLLTTEAWQTAEIVTLQESFVQQLLIARQRLDLWPAALDLIRYHYHHAEALLGPETLPAVPTPDPGRTLWKTPWQRGRGVRLVPFNYEIIDLLEMEGADLEEFTQLFRPVGSTALFLRRNNEVICESLQEDFSRLLQGCNGKQTPDDIFAGGVERREAEEILEFAVSEGILVVGQAT
jgi:radical SAM superfamily enzyme YgiQ (UPF0313 family)